MLRPNRTRQRLAAGETVLGSLSLIGHPALPEIVGAAGFDFFCIDTEHAAIDESMVIHMIRAAQSAAVTPIVRVRRVEDKELLWTLDSGAEGLLLPLIEDGATADRAYALTHFPPGGERTLCSATRGAGHGANRSELLSYLNGANQEVLLIGLIETPKGLANIGEIVKSGIDVFMVGRADLSLKMGLGYAPNDPRVVDASQRILSAALGAGCVAGVLAYSIDDARRWIEFGCRFIVYSQPEILLSNVYADAIKALGRPSSAGGNRVDQPQHAAVVAPDLEEA